MPARSITSPRLPPSPIRALTPGPERAQRVEGASSCSTFHVSSSPSPRAHVVLQNEAKCQSVPTPAPQITPKRPTPRAGAKRTQNPPPDRSTPATNNFILLRRLQRAGLPRARRAGAKQTQPHGPTAITELSPDWSIAARVVTNSRTPSVAGEQNSSAPSVGRRLVTSFPVARSSA